MAPMAALQPMLMVGWKILFPLSTAFSTAARHGEASVPHDPVDGRAGAGAGPYLYLGYWIDGSDKMAYKARFKPLEILGQDGWTARMS